jgi:aminopeptidase
MIDPRMTRLAELLIGHSTGLQADEHILIEAFDAPDEMVIELVKAAYNAGGHPHVALRNNRVMRSIEREASEDQLKTWADIDIYRMKKMACYIGLRGSHNVSERSDVPSQQMKKFSHHYMHPVHIDHRVKNTRWCVLRWPSPSMAQLAQMSTEAFEEFYFNACVLDYAKMAESVKPLAERMSKTDQVHIQGPGETDLHFSIKDIPVIPCTGSHNVPDGECFTSPARDSVNGAIHFNTPTIYNGVSFANIRLEFKDGKVVNSSCDGDNDRLEDILNTDEGSRYVGEFAIGFNPHILEPMKDILFDEKIAGSLHFTPGQAYEDADNGNRSDIHWDMVLIQRPDYGGGTISFDGEVIRKDGLFCKDDLKGLNPNALKK